MEFRGTTCPWTCRQSPQAPYSISSDPNVGGAFAGGQRLPEGQEGAPVASYRGVEQSQGAPSWCSLLRTAPQRSQGFWKAVQRQPTSRSGKMATTMPVDLRDHLRCHASGWGSECGAYGSQSRAHTPTSGPASIAVLLASRFPRRALDASGDQPDPSPKSTRTKKEGLESRPCLTMEQNAWSTAGGP